MFFISWGSQVLQRVFGAPEQFHCEICGEERTFRRLMTYRVNHILWLFRWVGEKRYSRVCTTCRNGPRLLVAEVDVKEAAAAIPFIDRLGWTLGIGGIAALGVMGFVAASVQDHNDAAWLASPMAGDIYEVDMAKLETHPEAPVMYSTLQVASVSADRIQVRLPKSYFDRETGPSTAVSDGRARAREFYTDELISLPLTALPKMQKDGVIMHVDR